MSFTILPSTFPANDATDGQFLYRSLGSFWTQIFQDKNALKGYSIGMAEELIQSYYKLVDTLNQYSVKDIPLFHTEKWQYLLIKKSEFNKAPFVFETDGAVFGVQPETDLFYANQLFRFGYSKQPGSKNVFSFTPSISIKEFSVIANRIISPSMLQIYGVDVVLKKGTLFFNNDLFNNPYIPKAKVTGEFGKIATFVDNDGKTQQDEFIVLWLYHASIDNKDIYSNFGTIFDLNFPSSQSYKDILKALMNLAVEGPTISALTTAFAALANTPIVIESSEKVEDIYNDERNSYVVTDKNVYKFPVDQELAKEVFLEQTLYTGFILSANIKVVDTVISPTWWKTEVQSSKLAFASHVFAANNKNQLFFENALRDIVCEISSSQTNKSKKITFPVQGRPEDVEAFQDYINQKTRQDELISKLGLSNTKTSTKTINPVDFIFENFIKANTLLVKLEFYSTEQLSTFFNLFPLLQRYLPSHVYLLLYLKLQLPVDTIENLNYAAYLPEYPITPISSDGSVTSTGARPGNSTDDSVYYKDYKNRFFCISVGPYKNVLISGTQVKKPLHYYDNLSELSANNNPGATQGIVSGKLRTEIPEYVRSPGESTYRRPSTREIPAILLIDF
jgi:hypothetical protein